MNAHIVAYVNPFAYLYAVKKKRLNSQHTMKRILSLCIIALMGLYATAQSITTASSSMTASPWAIRVPYDVAQEGEQKQFTFGMGGWSWDFFAFQQRNHCGKENLGIARIGFTGRFDRSYNALTDAQKATMDTELNNIVQTGVKSIFLLCGIGNVGDQQGDAPSKPTWTDTQRNNYVNDIVRAAEYIENKGYTIFAVAPFNEPDFEKTYTGTASNFNAVAAIMQTKPILAGKVFGPSTLNSTEAKNWYPTVKGNINYANTHQLAGTNFTDYTGFWSQAKADGKLPIADEMHNVMEAMVCINYGGVAGTWWGWEGITRGEYVRMINGGRQLVYKERPNEWMTASVNKYPGANGRVEAFIGSSERQAVASAFTFLSKGRLAYYDGYGPAYDYTEEVPGGAKGSYQVGQTNAERLININTGEDVPVEPINGKYKIVNKASGKVLSIEGGNLQRGNVYQWADGGLANQVWDVNPIDKTTVADYSYVIIRNANTSSIPLYLDAQAWAMDNNANVSVWSDGDAISTPANAWQRWHLRYVGDGYYNIINHNTGMFLNLDWGNPANGTNVNEFEGNGSDAQLWKFVPADHTVDATAPGAPKGLTATPQSGAIKLSWAANSEADIYGYMVYRYNATAGIWECIGRKVRGTTFLDNTCRKGQPLRYRIKALDGAYNLSAASAEVTTQTASGNTLIAQWTGLSLKDNGPNKMHAVANGVTNTTDSNRPAFSFDGSDDYVKLPYHTGDMQQMTFAAWVKGSSTTAWQRIFDFGNGEDEYLFLTPTNGSAMRFEIKKGGVTQGLNANTTLGTGTWKHIAVTIGANEVAIYVNGTKSASATDITLRPSDIAPAMSYLGRSQFDADPAFKGLMSDVRIYNYALSAEEVKSISSETISTSGYDITAERIPNIADNVNNWDTHTGKWTTWTSSTEDATNLTSPYVRTSGTGVSDLTKTLTYLPEGQYKLTANVYAYYRNTTNSRKVQQLFLNSQTLTINCATNRTATLRELSGTVNSDNKLEFGLKITSATSATNTAMDNVKLVYQGTKADYIEGIEAITYNMTSEARMLIGKPMNATAANKLSTVVSAADNALSSYTSKIASGTAAPADVNQWVAAMDGIASAVAAAKSSITAYQALGMQLTAAYTAKTNYPREFGNDAFAEGIAPIEANYHAGTYADSEIPAIVKEVKGITNRYLMADAVAYATTDNPVDVTSFMVGHASFKGDSYASWTTSPNPGMGYDAAEFFNTNFNIYQTLIGMPAGTYRLQTRGFYRYGNQPANKTAHDNGTLKRNAKLYITHETGGTKTADVMAISDDPSEDTYWGGWSSELYDGKPVPNNMQAGAHAIDGCGKYAPKNGYNSVDITVSTIGDLTIGAKKETLIGEDWSFFGDFSLHYLGDGEHTLTLDEKSVALPAIDKSIVYDKVTVNRTIKAGIWNTFVVPFDMDIPNNGWEVKALIRSELKGETITLTFEDADAIKAGVPYMVRVGNEVTQIIENIVEVSTTPVNTPTDYIEFVGVYGAGNVPEGSYFISNDLFYRAIDETNTIKAFRAYLKPIGLAANARSLSYRFAGEEGTTAIDNSQLTNDNEVTVVGIYTLSGMRIEDLQQGVNILQMSDGTTMKVVIK